MKSEDGKRVKTGGRQSGTPNALPDLRAITLKALMRAGGVDYLVSQANANPMGFMSLLGRVMPRESHVELSGELKVRQEVRRDLVEKLVVLMRVPESHANPAIEATTEALPAITHSPEAMLKAQKITARDSLTRRTESARTEGAAVARGITERAAAMHVERAQERSRLQSYQAEALQRIDGQSTPQPSGRANPTAIREHSDTGKRERPGSAHPPAGTPATGREAGARQGDIMRLITGVDSSA